MSNAATNRKLVAVADPASPEPSRGASAGGIHLARVLAREGDAFLVSAGGERRRAACDPCVDPALVEAAIASGARIVLEDGPEPLIVGALQTARAVEVSQGGEVSLTVKRFLVTAEEEATLRTGSAFLQVKGDEVELFARRILSRARELARVLARAIQLN
jgi:hypothetical protein